MCSANIVPKKKNLSQKVIFGIKLTLKILMCTISNKEVVQQNLLDNLLKIILRS